MAYPITRQFGPNAKGSELTFTDMDYNLLYLASMVTGSSNFIPMYSGSTYLTSSTIYQSAGLIGIGGITSPSARLDVNGNIIATGSITANGGDLTIISSYPRIYLTDTNNNSDFSIINDNGNFLIYDDTNTRYNLFVSSSGRIGINKFTPTAQLDINGGTTVSGSFNVTGSSVLNGALSVTGSSILNGTLTTKGDTIISGSLYATGSNVIITGSLRIFSPTLTSEIRGANSINLTSTGGNINLTATSGVNVSGDLSGGNIYSNRKVKIGDSTTPNTQLEITNSGSLVPTIRLNNTSSNSYYDIANTSNLYVSRNGSVRGLVVASGSGGATVFTTSSITLESGVTETYTTTNFGAGTYTLTYYWNGGDDISILDGSSTGSVLYNDGYGTPPLTSSFTFTTTNGYITFRTDGYTMSQVNLNVINITSFASSIRVGINKTSGSAVNTDGLDISGSLYVTGSVLVTSLSGAGSRAVNASSTGLLSAASDSRLKNKIEQEIPGLDVIKQITPRAYTWKHIENGAVELGFFADEVAPLIPSAAPMGNDGYYGFYDRSLLAVLVKAFQEQQAQIETLQQQVNTLLSGSI